MGPRAMDAWYLSPAYDHYRAWIFHIPSTGGNMEESGAVMLIRRDEVPSVHHSGAPAGSCFWWIKNGGACARWGEGDAIKIMGALDHMVGGDFRVYAGGA